MAISLKVNTPEQDKLNKELKRRQFAKSMKGTGTTMPEKDEALQLCIYCYSAPSDPAFEPYCSQSCVSCARLDNEHD